MAKFRAAGRKKKAPQRQSAVPCLVLLIVGSLMIFTAIFYSVQNP